MPQYMYATPIFITEVVHLVTYVQLFKVRLKVKAMTYSVSCQLAGIGSHNQLSNEQKRCISKQTRS